MGRVKNRSNVLDPTYTEDNEVAGVPVLAVLAVRATKKRMSDCNCRSFSKGGWFTELCTKAGNKCKKQKYHSLYVVSESDEHSCINERSSGVQPRRA